MVRPQELVRFRELVEGRLRQLNEDEMSGADAASAVELDQTRVGRLSRMDALQAQAMAVETSRRRKLEIRRLEAALVRIVAEDYGYCLSCGEAIAIARLELDPAATQCIQCAEKTER